MQKPLLLDLFSGAGGAARGYQRAGFYVVGVDIKPQPRYAGDLFIQMDALEFARKWGHGVDAIHASPPCQRYSQITPVSRRENHPDLIASTHDLLVSLDKPYCIENVGGARHLLDNPLMLCGSMFGLPIWRHRYFETSPPIYFPPSCCRHDFQPVPVNNSSVQKIATKKEASRAMGIDWMHSEEVRQSVPPDYTEWIGSRLLLAVHAKRAEALRRELEAVHTEYIGKQLIRAV